ncbi:homoserine O-acetyltransferase [PVC group bacterium (ex Bugula neritina AB1)]|nr:homoserine O-acetyltransferase [PVC group bacterium (ex Bugula neritina AB1)]
MSGIGVVKPQTHFFQEELQLESGEVLSDWQISYEMYGSMNESRTNVIWLIHALSGDAHAAGKHNEEDKKLGWWDMMIGPGKALDTNIYCVICSNVLGSCKGTTGPSSINPKTQKPYGLDFPMIKIGDMVQAQKCLMDVLNIPKFHTVIGASMGGMQVLEWAVRFPDLMSSIIVIASTSKLSAQSIAFNQVGRNAIMSDNYWNKGLYYDKKNIPLQGLAIARMIGHITYLSQEAMHRKFGRRLQDKKDLEYEFGTDFEVESYLKYQGTRFIKTFDANSYLYLTKAMDYFDLSNDHGSLDKAMSLIKSKSLIISFTSDWLFPSEQSLDIVHALMHQGKEVSFCDIETDCGHDSFLISEEPLTSLMKGFLDHV